MSATVTTGLTAPTGLLRAVSAGTGSILATDGVTETFAVTGSGTSILDGFQPGEDRLLLPAGTDLSTVRVSADWEGDAWGMRVSHGEGDSVFLRWGWQFDANRDLAVDGRTDSGASTGGSTNPPAGGSSTDTVTGGGATGSGSASGGTGGAATGSGSTSGGTDAITDAGHGTEGVRDVFTCTKGCTVIEGFESGEDKLLLPAGTDLSAVTVHADWEGDAWGMRVSYGQGDSAFLRWGWQFDASRDLAVAGGSKPGDATTPPGHTDNGTTTPDPVDPTDHVNPDGEVNVLIRGQSNALMFAAYGGAEVLERELEAKLGGDVHVLYAWDTEDNHNTMWSGTSFMDWDTDGQQHGLLNFIADLPADVKDNPTLTVWMHNEYDQNSMDLTTDQWIREVQTDAALVRAALGQTSATTPYEFVPIRYPYGGNLEAIQNGMERLSADAGFNADMSDAAWGARMDGGPETGSNGSHVGYEDAIDIGYALADELAPVLAKLTGSHTPTSPTSPTSPTNPTPPATSGDVEVGTGSDTLVLRVSGDAYLGAPQFNVHVNGKQIGGVMTATATAGEDSDTITLHGDWGGKANVTVTFLNDAWAGTPDTDRNLHIDGASFNGKEISGAAQTLWSDGDVSFTGRSTVTAPPTSEVPPPVVTPPATGGGTEPSGDSGAVGMTLVLSDDFSNGYLYENWGWPFGGGVYWNNAFSWNSDDVAVRNGELQVTITQQADGWWTAGGFNSFKADNTILYGKIEFDAKVPDHQGTMAAILTWPATDVWPQDGEIDILETPHNENMFSTHYAGSDGGHAYDSIRSNTFDASKWNHYEMTWLPDRLTIEVNGQLMAEWTDPAQIPDVPHGFGAMGFVGSPWDEWMGGAPDSSTPDQVAVSIDNVKMYQLDGIL